MKRYTLLVLAVIFAASQLSQAQSNLRKIGALYVDGQITYDGRRTEHVQIDLYKGNELIASTESDDDGFYKLRLEYNNTFTIEFKKEGALPKRIYFDTEMDSRYVSVPDYEMFIDLLPEEYLKGVSTGDLDFPMAIIKYNPAKGAYEHAPEYTFHMEYVVNKLLAEAAIKQELEIAQKNRQ